MGEILFTYFGKAIALFFMLFIKSTMLPALYGGLKMEKYLRSEQ